MKFKEQERNHSSAAVSNKYLSWGLERNAGVNQTNILWVLGTGTRQRGWVKDGNSQFKHLAWVSCLHDVVARPCMRPKGFSIQIWSSFVHLSLLYCDYPGLMYCLDLSNLNNLSEGGDVCLFVCFIAPPKKSWKWPFIAIFQLRF